MKKEGWAGMIRTKAYVCNRCRKAISYTVLEGGKTLPCMFCGFTVTLPSDKDFQPDVPVRKRMRLWTFLLLTTMLTGAGGYLFFTHSVEAATARKALSGLRAYVCAYSTVAPAPAKAHGSCVTVSVKEIHYDCPDIYYVGLKKTLRAEKPVLCVALEIANVGKTQIGFHSWRMPEAAADQTKATLIDCDGAAYGLVSFGVDTLPSGVQQRNDLAPGESFTDWAYFIGDEKPQKDLKLTLPCENIGGQGVLRFSVPCSMIR